MALSAAASAAYDQVEDESTKLGDIRRTAKAIKTDHTLAMELWSTGEFRPRLLAILAMDRKLLTQAAIDELDADLRAHPDDERAKLVDWLMANQLSRSRPGTRLMESWEHSPSPLQRRLFWYHQARLRWMGQTPPDNTEELLDAIEARMAGEAAEVQWAMNFTAGQIGTYDPAHRARCIAIGERTGLYGDEVVSRGCTPSYLPEFIRMQVEKVGT